MYCAIFASLHASRLGFVGGEVPAAGAQTFGAGAHADYLRFGLSYRDVEELPAERAIEVEHVTVYRWVQRWAERTGLCGNAGE